MSTDAAYEKNLIEYLSTYASNRRKPYTLCIGLTTSFNKRYGHHKGFGSFRDRAHKIFSKLHEIDLDILNKVEILYILKVTVSDEMKHVLDQFPSFRYTLDGRGKLVAFSSGDGVLTIEEENGKRKRDLEEVADGAPNPKRRRTGSEEATGGVAAEVEVREEDPEDAIHWSARGGIDRGVHRRGSLEPQEHPLERGNPGKQENPKSQSINHAEMDVKPIIQLYPERARVIKSELREPEQQLEHDARLEEQSQREALDAPEANESIVAPTISALDLAKRIAGMAHAFKLIEWHHAATEKIGLLSGKDQAVLLEDFSVVLQQVLSKINSHKKIGFKIGSIRIRDFLLVLETSVVYPLGVELMSEELKKIAKELEKIDKIEERAAEKGEVAETWMVPKDVVESCIKNLIRLTCY